MCTECIQAASSATASPPSPSLSMEAASRPSLRRASSGCEAVNWSTSSARNSRGCPGTLGSGGCGELGQHTERRLTLVPQKVPSELHPKVCNHGEGPSRVLLRDYEPSDGTF